MHFIYRSYITIDISYLFKRIAMEIFYFFIKFAMKRFLECFSVGWFLINRIDMSGDENIISPYETLFRRASQPGIRKYLVFIQKHHAWDNLLQIFPVFYI